MKRLGPLIWTLGVVYNSSLIRNIHKMSENNAALLLTSSSHRRISTFVKVARCEMLLWERQQNLYGWCIAFYYVAASTHIVVCFISLHWVNGEVPVLVKIHKIVKHYITVMSLYHSVQALKTEHRLRGRKGKIQKESNKYFIVQNPSHVCMILFI